jgi:hypothetical protein
MFANSHTTSRCRQWRPIDATDDDAELTFLDEGVERSLRRSYPRPVDLGQDPTTVHGLPIRMRNVTFDQPGQYTFYLLCDGQRIAQEQVEVR